MREHRIQRWNGGKLSPPIAGRNGAAESTPTGSISGMAMSSASVLPADGCARAGEARLNLNAIVQRERDIARDVLDPGGPPQGRGRRPEIGLCRVGKGVAVMAGTGQHGRTDVVRKRQSGLVLP